VVRRFTASTTDGSLVVSTTGGFARKLVRKLLVLLVVLTTGGFVDGLENSWLRCCPRKLVASLVVSTTRLNIELWRFRPFLLERIPI
jgi:hypothetical protein